MKKILRAAGIIVSVGVIGFCLCGIIANYGSASREVIEQIDRPISLKGSQLALVDDVNNIYICNGNTGDLQVFNQYGLFLYGYKFPMRGGTYWACMNENMLYIYIIRRELQLEIKNGQILNTYEENYHNPQEFLQKYRNYSYEKKAKIGIINKVSIINTETNEESVVKINAPFYPLSNSIYFIALFIFFIITILLTGVVKRIVIDMQK